MSHELQIEELLEEILESERSAEDVCAKCPELLAEVRERLKRLRSVESEVDFLFPLSGGMTRPFEIPLSLSGPELPSIPGYEVQTTLGRGGAGIVYKALHLKLHRPVALKMLLAGSYASPQERIRFVREAEAVAALRHPNIVQVYDIGEVQGHPYFTMEYLDGGTLAQKLAGAIQPARESAETIATLAHAVYAAHQCGIIHRDLKPSNILLTNEDSPKISDFRLARRLDGNDGLTRTGARLGTPNYMAPEQMTGGSASVGPAADIFALGAMLYEMLTGTPPFRGASLSETERRLITEEPILPSRLNGRAPRDLETICLKCLEKDPHTRYATAGDLAADLGRFLRHEPIHARPVAPLERATRWIRRNPLLTALAVTGMILIGLIINEATQEWAQNADRLAEKSRLTARFESGVQLVQDGRFAEARAILGKLGDGGFEDLRQRIDRTLGDLSLVEELESIGVHRALAMNGRDDKLFHDAAECEEYETVFARTGFGKVHDNPQAVAQRINNSDIQETLVAAIDDWTVCETDVARRSWLLDVARRADPDPKGWRDRVRDPANWRDRQVLAQLAETSHEAKPSVQLLLALSDRLAAAGLDATAFRKQVQQGHADSFLANFSLANALREPNPAESIRYYQAALAIRPLAAPAHNNLGVALANLGRTDEAIAHYEQALKLAPQSRRGHYNFGLALVAADRLDEAIEQFEQTVKLAPNFASAHGALGETLLKQDRSAEAEPELRRCLSLLPADDPDRSRLTDLMRRCEQLRSSNAESPAAPTK